MLRYMCSGISGIGVKKTGQIFHSLEVYFYVLRQRFAAFVQNRSKNKKAAFAHAF